MASPTKSSLASDKIRKTLSGKSPESAIQAKNKKGGTYTCYIPENINIDKLIKISPPDIPSFHKDNLVYILHLITDIPTRNKGKDMLFVPIYSSLIQRRVREYRKYLDYLVSNTILIEDKQYIKGVKSRSFQFNKKYHVKTKPIIITKRTLVKSILQFKNIEYSYEVIGSYTTKTANSSQQNFDVSYLTKWFDDGLTVDYDTANNKLLNLLEEEKNNPEIKSAEINYRLRNTVLQKIKRKEFATIVDNTSNRFHSPLTQLKSELRHQISYNGNKLFSIDIVNSQPYLSSALLNLQKIDELQLIETIIKYNDKIKPHSIMLANLVKEISSASDVILYKELVSNGRFYEAFGDILASKSLIQEDEDKRKNAKAATFLAIFSPNTQANHIEAIKNFREVFPNVFKLFSLIKRRNHPALAVTLQNLEARIIIFNICKQISINYPEAPIFTLHDSIITTAQYISPIYKLMYNTLYSSIGLKPSLKVEEW